MLLVSVAPQFLWTESGLLAQLEAASAPQFLRSHFALHLPPDFEKPGSEKFDLAGSVLEALGFEKPGFDTYAKREDANARAHAAERNKRGKEKELRPESCPDPKRLAAGFNPNSTPLCC